MNSKVGPMRQGSHPKRLRGRGNGRKSNSNVRTHNFESNGPDVKVRGNAQQVVEKYLALARDATSAGDRIAAESYFQHAEHYYRVLTAANGGTHPPPPRDDDSESESEDRTNEPASRNGGAEPDRHSAAGAQDGGEPVSA